VVEDFTREVRAPVDLVVEALREQATEWRESVVPPELRRKGVTRMKGSIQPPFFRFWLWSPGGRNDFPSALRGVVVAGPGGGSRIRGECGRRFGSPLSITMWMVAGSTLVGTIFGIGGGVLAAIFGAFIGGPTMLGIAAHRPAKRSPEAEYLFQRLDLAVAAAEEKAAAAPGALPPSRAATPKSPARMPWKRA
jgi:hypothetical protein